MEGTADEREAKDGLLAIFRNLVRPGSVNGRLGIPFSWLYACGSSCGDIILTLEALRLSTLSLLDTPMLCQYVDGLKEEV
jgi:hypothetical protein